MFDAVGAHLANSQISVSNSFVSGVSAKAEAVRASVKRMDSPSALSRRIAKVSVIVQPFGFICADYATKRQPPRRRKFDGHDSRQPFGRRCRAAYVPTP